MSSVSVQDVCKEYAKCVKGVRLCARVRPSSSREREVYVQWRPRGRRSFECKVRATRQGIQVISSGRAISNWCPNGAQMVPTW